MCGVSLGGQWLHVAFAPGAPVAKKTTEISVVSQAVRSRRAGGQESSNCGFRSCWSLSHARRWPRGNELPKIRKLWFVPCAPVAKVLTGETVSPVTVCPMRAGGQHCPPTAAQIALQRVLTRVVGVLAR